jgi:RNA polymerase sigma factor (sigma-70 family)
MTIDRAQEERERLHARAADVADAVLRRYVLARSLDAAEAEDVRAAVMLRLVQRLDGQSPDVRSLDDFVAMMVHNAVRDVFRGRRPDRTRLRKRVQAVLREDERFTVLRDDATWCALREHGAARRVENVALTTDDFLAAQSLSLDELLVLLLRRAGGAVRIETLIDLIAEATGVSLAGETTTLDEPALADAAPGAETQLIARQTLAALWDEIRALSLPQRTALLLHLRDDHGSSAIPLLVFTGVATLDEIGASLELGRARMEQLWDKLPLPDLEIAELMQTTRARVIALRRAARERLGRLLRHRGEERS